MKLKPPEFLLRLRERLGWREIFALALLFHFCCFLFSWNHSLLEHHSYRQTQTAMAIRYMIREDAWINYLTPVLGPPWQVPFEFPFYQMAVAGFSILFHTSIEPTGRAMSLAFFYASLWPMNLVLKRLIPEQRFRYMVLSLVLFSPLYLYFSRAVMIESTAFFFGFLFLSLNTRQLLKPTWLGMAVMLLSGAVCAVVKITTFCTFCFPCLTFPLIFWNEDRKKKPLVQAIVLGVSFLVPLSAGSWWTRRADAIKLANPITEQLTSADLQTWAFGSLAQRLDPQAWLELATKLSFGLTFLPVLVILFAIVFFFKDWNRKTGLLLLACAFLPLVVFFNLHVVHDYYFYASSIFTIFALGYALASLMRIGQKWGKLVWLSTALAFVSMYGFFMSQIKEDQSLIILEVAKTIQENSSEGDLLLIYGDVWDSRIPYYADRKAFMNYFFEAEEIRSLDLKIDKAKDLNRVRLAVVNTAALPLNPYLLNRLRLLGFSSKPDYEMTGFSIFCRDQVP